MPQRTTSSFFDHVLSFKIYVFKLHVDDKQDEDVSDPWWISYNDETSNLSKKFSSSNDSLCISTHNGTFNVLLKPRQARLQLDSSCLPWNIFYLYAYKIQRWSFFRFYFDRRHMQEIFKREGRDRFQPDLTHFGNDWVPIPSLVNIRIPVHEERRLWINSTIVYSDLSIIERFDWNLTCILNSNK